MNPKKTNYMIILDHEFDLSDTSFGYYSSGNFTYKILNCKICDIKVYYRKDAFAGPRFSWLMDGHFWSIIDKNNITCKEMQIKSLLE